MCGSSIRILVEQRHITDSDPCNKINCMVTRAISEYLVKTYGGKLEDYKIKSTNHGTTFVLNGYKYNAVFDNKTAAHIFEYDRTYRKTGSKERARAAVRPFTARVMIESSDKVVKSPPMTEETKKRLRALSKSEAFGARAISIGKSRDLSI